MYQKTNSIKKIDKTGVFYLIKIEKILTKVIGRMISLIKWECSKFLKKKFMLETLFAINLKEREGSSPTKMSSFMKEYSPTDR